MSGFSPVILDRREVEYRCTCSRERILAALSGISRGEIDDVCSKEETIEVTCQFCDAIYKFGRDELEITV